MNKKTEDILFYAAAGISPSKKGLERILEKIPVTYYDELRYTNAMGLRLAFPIGIIAIMLAVFLVFGKKNVNQPQQVITLPASVTRENVETSLNQVDTAISNSTSDMDKELNELDQEDTNEDLNDL